MERLSILTLSRRVEHFKRLARSLDKAGSEVERLLVNNANDPRMTALALRHGWAVIEPGYNTSFSVGNNLAAKAAAGDWLLLLNDDLRIKQARFIETLWTARLQADVVGALLLHGDGTVNHAGTLVDRTRTDHIGRHDPQEKWRHSAYVPSVTFAAALIRRSLWDQLGGLAQRYVYGFEDTDFCLRAIEVGASIYCERGAIAVHDECGTRPRGGARDEQNMRTFFATWQDLIPGLLEGYRERHPDAEGIR